MSERELISVEITNYTFGTFIRRNFDLGRRLQEFPRIHRSRKIVHKS